MCQVLKGWYQTTILKFQGGVGSTHSETPKGIGVPLWKKPKVMLKSNYRLWVGVEFQRDGFNSQFQDKECRYWWLNSCLWRSTAGINVVCIKVQSGSVGVGNVCRESFKSWQRISRMAAVWGLGHSHNLSSKTNWNSQERICETPMSQIAQICAFLYKT